MRKILLIALLALLAGCPRPQQQAQVPAGGELAARPPAGAAWTGNATDFSFTNFAAGEMKLSSLAGKPVLLNFWADW